MIIEIKYATTKVYSMYVTTREELFEALWALDSSSAVKAWKVPNYDLYKDFGFANNSLNKKVDSFTPEHYGW